MLGQLGQHDTRETTLNKRAWLGFFVLAEVGIAALALTDIGRVMGQGMMGPGGMRQGGMGRGMGGGSGYGPNSGGELKNPVPSTSTSIAKGKASFQAQCVACHGPEGLGNGPAAAGLNPPPANLKTLAGTRPDGVWYFTITNGRGVMPAFQASLSETERWNVVNFLRSLAR